MNYMSNDFVYCVYAKRLKEPAISAIESNQLKRKFDAMVKQT